LKGKEQRWEKWVLREKKKMRGERRGAIREGNLARKKTSTRGQVPDLSQRSKDGTRKATRYVRRK